MRLTQRINAALLVIGIIPLVLLTTYALSWFHDSVREHSRQAFESLATQVTKEVSRSLQDGSNALDFLGKNGALLNPETPEETLKAVLLDTVNFHPILNDIYVLDPSSRVRASARYSFRGEWTQNIWFRKALDGERVISDAHAVLYPFGVVMTMAQPLRMEGKPLSGVLIGQFDLYGFNQIVDSIFDKDGQALIIDHRGYVVATSGSEEILGDYPVPEVVRLARAGKAGVVDFQNRGGSLVAAVQPVPNHPWSVVLVRSQRSLYAAAFEMQHGLYLTLGLTLLSLVILSTLFSRHVGNRLRLVFDTALTLRSGGTVSLDTLGQDEIGEMARILSQISMELHQSRQELLEHQHNLEDLVQKRSLDLRLANKELQQEVAERAQAQKNLAEKQREIEHILRTAPVGIAVCQNFLLHAPNTHLQMITGFSQEELENMPIAKLMPNFDDFLELEKAMERIISDLDQPAPPGSMESVWRKKDGSSAHVLLCFSPAGTEWVLSVMDISTRKAMEEQLRHMALHDALTGLGNRTLGQDRLARALKHAHRVENYKYALAFIDLDRFKVVNDSQGHAVGDLLLMEVGKRLCREVREVDTVCRFGGDEFLIILDGLDAAGNAIAIARRLQEAVREPFFLEEREYQLTASLGLFIGQGPADVSAEQIIQRGNIAMHWAKESGRNCFKVFTKRLMNRAVELMVMENDLRQAVVREELFLEYQPIVHADGRLFGFEALVRWQHPTQGRIPPDRFISVAEDTGTIHALGEWVMLNACRTMAAWNRELGLDLTISVNMSGRQFGQANVTSRIQACLDQCDMPPAWLKLEITESSLMKHLARPQETLGRLRQMDIALSVDDFGTGYSSLSYLQRLPLDYLKIDRSFVRFLTTNPESQAIVQAIVQLGHTLGMRIIAEGVETWEHLEQLRELGCDLYQGYYFARPLPEAAAREFIISNTAVRSQT